MTDQPLLALEDVHTFYGAIHALKGISLHVNEGETVAVIGGNGAGKTTALMTICGIQPARTGTIRFAGEPIEGLPAHRIVTRGVCQVPEGRHIFPRLTVTENLEMGAYAVRDRRRSEPRCRRCSTSFRSSPSAGPRPGARSPAASSRCSPWDAP